MGRKIADCRRFESDNNCSLTIIGEEDEVIATAAQHAVAAHGHQDTPSSHAAAGDARARGELRAGHARAGAVPKLVTSDPIAA